MATRLVQRHVCSGRRRSEFRPNRVGALDRLRSTSGDVPAPAPGRPSGEGGARPARCLGVHRRRCSRRGSRVPRGSSTHRRARSPRRRHERNVLASVSEPWIAKSLSTSLLDAAAPFRSRASGGGNRQLPALVGTAAPRAQSSPRTHPRGDAVRRGIGSTGGPDPLPELHRRSARRCRAGARTGSTSGSCLPSRTTLTTERGIPAAVRSSAWVRIRCARRSPKP